MKKGGDKPRHYYDVAVIGYTTDDQGNAVVESALGGPLGNTNPVATDIVSIVELSDNPLRLKDDDGASVPVWVEPVARGGTPMIAGLTYCRELASWWASNHPLCVPPIVIHITDGEESNDGNPEQVARALQAVATQRGNTLLFNVHLSRSAAEGQVFPNDEASLPNDEAKMLFRMLELESGPTSALTMARTSSACSVNQEPRRDGVQRGRHRAEFAAFGRHSAPGTALTGRAGFRRRYRAGWRRGGSRRCRGASCSAHPGHRRQWVQPVSNWLAE